MLLQEPAGADGEVLRVGGFAKHDALDEDDDKRIESFPLAMAREGECVRIVRLQGGHGLEMRLTQLGLNVGSKIRVSQRMGGRLIVLRDEMRLALGAGVAQKIMVKRLQEHPDG